MIITQKKIYNAIVILILKSSRKGHRNYFGNNDKGYVTTMVIAAFVTLTFLDTKITLL